MALNPAGSPVDPKTCLPYALALELANEFNIVQPSAQECQAAATGRGGPGDGSDNAVTNTTIAVVATDAPLEDLEAERMAVIANDGLARAIKPIHGIGDGDTIFVPKAERFFVTGHVRNPGAYNHEPNLTVLQAISLAGGLTDRGSNRGMQIIRNKKPFEAKLTDIVQAEDTIVIRQRRM